jgi:hypothetical protein
LRALLFTLVLPMSLAIGADWLAGTLPWVTIAAVLICIPLATVVVNRTVLAEFDRVVAFVAPPDSEEAGQEAGQEDSLEEYKEQDGNGEPPAENMSEMGADSAADSTPTDWPLDGQPFTEGAQRHHG